MQLKGTRDILVVGSAYPTVLRNRVLSFCYPWKPPSWEDPAFMAPCSQWQPWLL